MKWIAFLLSNCLLFNGLAQEKKDTSILLPVEVRATRASKTAPFAKTNISHEEIEKGNLGQDLPFLLNQTPSIVVSSDAGNGVGYTYMHIRGSDATRINVTLNGIPYNDAESELTYFVDLPDFASSVNSIQIQRGVGTSSNGAGAFGATINFSTNETNARPYVEINNSYGSFYTLKNTVKAGTGLIGHHFTTDIRLSRISSDGYIDRAFSNLQSLYYSSAYISDKNDLRFNLIAGKERTYQAWYGVLESDLKAHRTINYAGMEKPGDPYLNQTDNYWQNHYQLFYTHRFTSFISFNMALFYTKGYGYYEEYKTGQNYMTYYMPYPINGTDTTFTTDLVRQLWLDNDYYGSTFSFIRQLKKTVLTIGGAGTKYNGAHYGLVTWAQQGINGNPLYYDVNAIKKDANIYAKWQQDLSNTIQSFIDLQVRQVDYLINGFENNPQLILHPNYTFFNPKAGITYHLNKWMIYGSYSISNKEPIRDDFEASQQQQPVPEHMGDAELGVEYKYSKYSWSANLYYMKYKDQLVLTGKINDVGAYTRTNIPKSYRMGIELQGSATLTDWLKASANISISRNKILHFTEFIDNYDNGSQKANQYSETDISFSPSVIGAATLTIMPVRNFSIDLQSKYVSKQYLDNTSNNNRSLNPFFVEDARIIYSFSKKQLKNVQLIFQVYNAFNKLYEPNGSTYSYYSGNTLNTENYYSPMAGTNVMAGVNIKIM